MIKKRLNFNYDIAIIGSDGRFIIINISIYNIGFGIASIYGPFFLMTPPSSTLSCHHSPCLLTEQ